MPKKALTKEPQGKTKKSEITCGEVKVRGYTRAPITKEVEVRAYCRDKPEVSMKGGFKAYDPKKLPKKTPKNSLPTAPPNRKDDPYDRGPLRTTRL